MMEVDVIVNFRTFINSDKWVQSCPAELEVTLALEGPKDHESSYRVKDIRAYQYGLFFKKPLLDKEIDINLIMEHDIKKIKDIASIVARDHVLGIPSDSVRVRIR